jgi:hypothetical protein
MRKRIAKHCGAMTSFHNMAQERYNPFISPKATIVEMFAAVNDKEKALYMSHLSYSVQCGSNTQVLNRGSATNHRSRC